MKVKLFVLSFFLINGCAPKNESKARTNAIDSITFDSFTFDSIAIVDEYTANCQTDNFLKINPKEFLSNPGKYDKKWCEVIGYYFPHFETSALYLADQHAYKNALWVEYEDSNSLAHNKTKVDILDSKGKDFTQIDNKYVIVRGFVDLSTKGHYGQYIGTIRDLCYIGVIMTDSVKPGY